MIKFSNWNIEPVNRVIARKRDNLTRSIDVYGEIPDGWSWVALFAFKDEVNVLSLSKTETGLNATLTEQDVPYDGKYLLQLRGTQGDKVRHTNIIPVVVGDSISPDEKWPTIPSEFSQAEARIRELNEHPPIPGVNGYWMLWDTEQDKYVESDIPLPSGGGGGGYRIGSGLKLDLETNTLSVDTVSEVIEDNTQPITSAAVYTTVGNIEVILKTI